MKELLRRLARAVFEAGQRVGFDLLPRHFYSEIPCIRYLRSAQHWKEPFSMIGVSGLDLEDQLQFLQSCCTPDLVNRLKSNDVYPLACEESGEVGYGPTEADFLHCFIRSGRPQKIVQVGCGVSTAVMLQAAGEGGYQPLLVCIDPYPSTFLRRLDRQNRIRLVTQKYELTDFQADQFLDEGDLLFIDSTHTLGPSGEVSRIILELLPRLKKNVWVHFHDINFPYDYTRRILSSDLFFPHESALLHALLVNNSQCHLVLSLSLLHYFHRQELRGFLPNYQPGDDDFGLERSPGHFPSSVYLKVIHCSELGPGRGRLKERNSSWDRTD